MFWHNVLSCLEEGAVIASDRKHRAPAEDRLLGSAFRVQAIFNGVFALIVGLTGGAGIGVVLFVAGTAALFLSYAVGYALSRWVARSSHPGWVFLVFPLFANSIFLVLGAWWAFAEIK